MLRKNVDDFSLLYILFIYYQVLFTLQIYLNEDSIWIKKYKTKLIENSPKVENI